MWVQSLGQEDPLGFNMATHSSFKKKKKKKLTYSKKDSAFIT